MSNAFFKNISFSFNTMLRLLVALLFAIAFYLNYNLAYVDDIYAAADKIFFYPKTTQAFAYSFIVFIVVFLGITAFHTVSSKIKISYNPVARTPEKRDYLLWVIIFILLICAWSPYILSYFPGGIYPDTATCIGQARSGAYNNQQPLLYTMLFKICIIIAGELHAVMLFSILQIIFMAACFSYILYRLNLHDVNKFVLVLVLLYFALFNLIPLYVVSLWKDSLFSVALLMYIFKLTESVLLSKDAPERLEIVQIIIWMVLSMFLRNNGIYVMILTSVILSLVYGKSLLKDYKVFFISTFAALILTYIVQGPVFSKLNLNGPFVENLGVLQQQVAYVQVIGGDMTEEQAEFLNKVMPLETMKGFYRPFVVDTIKWCDQYNNEFLEENKGEFLKVWAGMLKENPKLYMDAYLYITLGYWNPFKQSEVSYINPQMWPDLVEVDRYWQKDVIRDMTGNSIRENLYPKTLYSSALFLFITLILFTLSVNKKDKSWLAFVPALTTYLTVFLATPLAFALRYVYIVVLTVPLFIIIPFLQCSDSTTGKADEAP